MTTTETVSVTLTMPIILTRDHSPNGRHGHYLQKARITKRLRHEAYTATMSFVHDPAWRQRGGWAALGWGDRFTPVVMDVTVAWPKGRKAWDDDNVKAALKPVLDGISDALWGGEDRHVTLGEVTQTRGSGGLTITLRAEAA